MRAEHIQECHPFSIWNYFILLGDSNKNNNNKTSQLGSVLTRYLWMLSSVSAERITPACSQNKATTFYPALPLSCFLHTAVFRMSHKPFWVSFWMLEPPWKAQVIRDLKQNLLEFEICLNLLVWVLCLHWHSKFTAHSYPCSQVALNNKRNLPFYLWRKRRSKARQLVKSILYARQIRTLVA